MPFDVDSRQTPIRELACAFALEHFATVTEFWDRHPEPRPFPHELYRTLGEAGFLGFPHSTAYGGGGKSRIEYITLIEELFYHDAALALLANIGELAMVPIAQFGSSMLRKKFLPDLISGKRIVAFVLTEPSSGSDAANMTTTAVDRGDHYLVSGEKTFIMHGDVADVAVLYCKVEGQPKVSCFVVETDQPGWQKRTLQHKMGMRAATTGAITLTDVRIPKDHLIGELNKGLSYAFATLDGARIGVAAQGVGIAQRAFDESVAWAKSRHAFGGAIARLQAIQWMIADMSTRLEAARLLTYKAAMLMDAGMSFSLEAAQAKLFATEAAHYCVDKAMQIHGGSGYIGELSVIEKLYRDQRVLEIYEGTSEIQRLVIAGNLLGKEAKEAKEGARE